MRVNLDPEVRIRVICESIFPTIYDEFRRGMWSGDDAIEFLDKYKGIALELVDSLPDKERDEKTRYIKLSYDGVKKLIEDNEMPMIMDGREFLRANGYYGYWDGKFHKDDD